MVMYEYQYNSEMCMNKYFSVSQTKLLMKELIDGAWVKLCLLLTALENY